MLPLVLAACTAELTGPSGHISSGSGGESSGGAQGAGDLPCSVQAFLGQYCQNCHTGSSSLPLLSHADLTRSSAEDPSLTLAQVAVLRLGATDQSRMPPAPMPLPPADEVNAFSTWVQAGAAVASCSDVLPPPPPDPYDTPVTCTSATHWTGGNRESPDMNPGQACIACHTAEEEGPDLVVAGTLYPTAHEPDDCNGVPASSGAIVVITDAAGRVFELELESSGNFMLEDPDAFTMPYSAKVVSGDQERVMVAKQESGDCNECHTESGARSAPGRIMLP